MANYCPECSEALMPPGTDCKACGWSTNRAQANESGYPTLADVHTELAAILRRHKAEHCLPPDPLDAARAWLTVIEKPKAGEQPQQYSKGERVFYRWPYAERAVYCLLRFLTLDERGQRLILAAREDEIFWRGDDLDFFRRVIDETFALRDMGVEAYRADASKKLRALSLRRIAQPSAESAV